MIAFAIAAPVALGSGAVLMNPQIRASALSQAEDILGLLHDRSPGERSFAVLTKKEPRAPGRIVEVPPPDVERGLGKVFPPEPDNPGLEFLTPPEFALLEGPPGEPSAPSSRPSRSSPSAESRRPPLGRRPPLLFPKFIHRPVSREQAKN